MQTEIVAAELESSVARALELLDAGQVVALPTETVYGLAADALNPEAVARIFEAKERPRFDPLIIHLPDQKALDQVSEIETETVQRLTQTFWPGPLTIVLRKRDTIPDIVTAGLETVAVRMSANPIFTEIVGKFGRPIAAPSANRFGQISPTQASHVLDELGGRIPLIVNGGPTQHGIESTVVRIVSGSIEILRNGPVTAERLAEFAPIVRTRVSSAPLAPGQLPSHYAPRAKLVVVDALESFSGPSGKRIAALSFRDSTALRRYWTRAHLSERGDLREAAANLFQRLRELDRQNPDLIVAELVPAQGIGAAINERLRRAAG